MKPETEEHRLARLIGGKARGGKITIDLTQARLLAQELEVLEALVDRKVLSPEYELLTEHGPESLLDAATAEMLGGTPTRRGVLVPWGAAEDLARDQLDLGERMAADRARESVRH